MTEIALAFLAGLLIGSFLNVCIFRLPRDLSVVRPRSFCPGCEKPIAWHDNIPLVSYALLGGRCRHCRERIPIRYPAVELATAIAFALSAAAYGASLLALKYCIFSALLIMLTACDFETQILPDEFTLGGTAIGLVLAAFVRLPPDWSVVMLPRGWSPRWTSVAEAAIGAGVLSGLLWLVGWAFEKLRHHEGLGFGDVKMIAMIGAFLGFQGALLSLLIGSLLGSVIGLIYSRMARTDWRTQELPFGSFLGIAALIVSILYSRIIY